MLSMVVCERERFRTAVFEQISVFHDADRVNALNESDKLTKKLEELDAKYNMVYSDRLEGLISNIKVQRVFRKVYCRN